VLELGVGMTMMIVSVLEAVLVVVYSTEPLVCDIVVVLRDCVLSLDVGTTTTAVSFPIPLCVEVYSMEPLVCVVVTVAWFTELEPGVG
jgi:hypothetical protein